MVGFWNDASFLPLAFKGVHVLSTDKEASFPYLAILLLYPASYSSKKTFSPSIIFNHHYYLKSSSSNDNDRHHHHFQSSSSINNNKSLSLTHTHTRAHTHTHTHTHSLIRLDLSVDIHLRWGSSFSQCFPCTYGKFFLFLTET